MLSGAFSAKTKDGTIYYRSSLTYKRKHISLGSFPTEEEAHLAYKEGTSLLSESEITLENYTAYIKLLDFTKAITLLNFRDNGVYIKNPIYLKQNYFLYFLAPQTEYKFDIDDLFFYSSHKIMQRGGRLFVNEYGMQTGILSRYGVRNHAVLDIDYTFANVTPSVTATPILLSLPLPWSCPNRTQRTPPLSGFYPYQWQLFHWHLFFRRKSCHCLQQSC